MLLVLNLKPSAPSFSQAIGEGERPATEASVGLSLVYTWLCPVLCCEYECRSCLSAAVGFLAVSSVITMSAPFFLGRIIDVIYTNPSEGYGDSLTRLCAVLTCVFLCGAAANGIRVYLMQSSGQSFFVCFVLVWFGFGFFETVSLCSPGCPGTHFIDQAGLKLRNPPASASQVLGLKACATTARLQVSLVR
jgi:hypothetical protein